jgi:hypothetical protein
VNASPPLAPAPVEPCPNCGAPVADRFCGACGQERKALRMPFRALVGELAGEVFSADSKIARTLGPLLVRPGAVTRAYLDGRRARYTSPVKLYLLTSFVFFLAQALGPDRGSAHAGAEDRDPVAISSDGLRELRAMGPAAARIADRIEDLSRQRPEEVRRRVGAALSENVPKAMFFLVPVLAVLLRLVYPRSGVYLAEHAVLALHEHVVAFVFLLPAVALGSSALQTAGLAATGLHLAIAMRRVYARPWTGTVVRAAVVAVLYLVGLALALAAATLAAVLVA